ncbi:WYL domain-containing protein [Scytonema sp. NUACC26]|uniref:WYL domain-containing protein n=1 Tax=Scytonema sp. NUACC26 TaxID=3140176 RepID=UPI0034DC9088
MSKKRKDSHGPVIRDRAKHLLGAILNFKDYTLDGCESLILDCRWKEQGSASPKLVIRTTLRVLEELSCKYKYEEKLTKVQIREALNNMKNFLDILEDNREHERGSEKWHFTLKLWSTNKEINLEKFTQEWNRRRTPKSKQKSEVTDELNINSPNQPLFDNSDTKKNVWSDERIEILQKALRLFTDMGQLQEALSIANLLLERRELSIPLRTEIEDFLRTHQEPWRRDIDDYIHRQQPFQLSYQEPTGNLCKFTVHHAKVVLHEEQQYLDCWCEETEGNQDVEQLRHNWIFRLDRILEAKVSPIDGKWLPDLNSITVEMHLFGRLVHGYKSKKNNDISNQLLNVNGQQVRKVLREVSSTFWFFREVIRYAPDCVIVAPDSVRERFKQKLIALCHSYNLTRSD